MNKLIVILKNVGCVNNDNERIVIYGLQKIKIILEDIALVIIGGMIFGNVIAAIIYESAYIILRIYAGGYHAATEKKCKCLSLISLVASLIVGFCKIFKCFCGMFFIANYSTCTSREPE